MEDENSWVFDSLVAFLNGPIWSAPLDSLIEEKSLIFEPDEEDRGEYKAIFDEYKNLVDFMLGNFMEDIGITPQQFEEACNKGHRYPIHFEQNLFEQIWAANDYEMFKRMMTQKNVELQLQALELIERKYGITPDSFKPKKKSDDTKVTIEKPSHLEEEIMEEVAKKFRDEEPSTSSKQDIKDMIEEKPILQETLKKTKEKTVKFNTEKIEEIPQLSQQIGEISIDTKPSEKPTDAEISYDKVPTHTEVDSVDTKDLKRRQEYLRAQRDRLVALKKEVRKKHLNDSNTESKSTSRARPKSAKAAESVMSGESTIAPQQLQIRKALAERFKSEVIATKKS